MPALISILILLITLLNLLLPAVICFSPSAIRYESSRVIEWPKGKAAEVKKQSLHDNLSTNLQLALLASAKRRTFAKKSNDERQQCDWHPMIDWKLLAKFWTNRAQAALTVNIDKHVLSRALPQVSQTGHTEQGSSVMWPRAVDCEALLDVEGDVRPVYCHFRWWKLAVQADFSLWRGHLARQQRGPVGSQLDHLVVVGWWHKQFLRVWLVGAKMTR